MLDLLAFSITVMCAAAALVTAGFAIAGGYARRITRIPLVLLQLALLAQAVLAGVAMISGVRPGEPTVFLAYLVASLVVLPSAYALGGEDDRWSGLIIAVGLLAQAVIVVRMATTWRS